jgi:large subunit ribosomal protein L21
MYAVVRTGGYQYIMKEGDKLTIPLLDAEPGSVVKFDDVLFLKTDAEVMIGCPKVANALVEAKVVAHVTTPKVLIYKFIKRENYRRKKGHKQHMTEVEVSRVGLAG